MRAVFYVLMLGALPLRAFAQDDAPPSELFSPDKKYSITIIDQALPGANPDTGDETLVVTSGGKTIVRLPTTGYLIDAHWSPDGKYVAVNDRRGTSGDYLWVISLADGKAVRTPNDDDIEPFIDRIVAKFPEYRSAEFHKRLTVGLDWKSSGELVMRTTLGFEKVDFYFTLTDSCKVDQGRLVLESEKITKKPLTVPL